MNEVVLAVPVGERRAGIVRADSGALIFGGSVDVGGGVVLTDFRPYDNVVEGHTVVAGRLPPGAAGVVVIDDCGDEFVATVGDGVWVAVGGEAGFSEPLVRFIDSQGGIVAPPLPTGPCRPVADADQSCPVCGAVAWSEVDAGDGRTEVRCERCGLSVAAGVVLLSFDVATYEDLDDEDLDESDGAVDEWSRERAAALASVTFPVYAVTGQSASVDGWSGDDNDVSEVDIVHAVDPALLHVASRRWRDDTRSRRHGLREQLAVMVKEDVLGEERSEAAVKVRMADAERAARRRAARPPVTDRGFVIDGAAEPFAFVASDGAWIASRQHYGVEVTISARGVDPATVALERLLDVRHIEAGTMAEATPEVSAGRRAAAGGLLGREEVTALIDACGLGEYREEILGAVLAGYRLERGGDGRTRIGGLPDMADGEVWPHGADGIPYTFVAQIDCSALRPLTGDFAGPEWRHCGALLRIFAALDARAPEPGPALGLACAPDAAVIRASLPPRPEPMPDSAWDPGDESLRVLRETPVRAVPFLTAAVGWYVLPDGAREVLGDAYREFAQRLAAGGAPPVGRSWGSPQLLGHAESVQGEDPRYAGGWLFEEEPDLQDLNAWRILINIADGYEGMSFGDGGALAIVAPMSDLAGGRYNRLVTEPSMG